MSCADDYNSRGIGYIMNPDQQIGTGQQIGKNVTTLTNGSALKPNIPLLIFDILLLPIHLVRLLFIYFWGSKYGLRGFQFLDVIMHADNPYFNQEDCSTVNTIKKDYRVVVRNDSRIFPIDIKNLIDINQTGLTSQSNVVHNNSQDVDDTKTQSVQCGSTDENGRTKNNNIWDISTEEVGNTKKHKKIKTKKSEQDDGASDRSDESDQSDQSDQSDDETDEIEDLTEKPKNKKEIKGVNYFDTTDDNDRNIMVKKKIKLLDSIRDELNSAFDD
jgi:hypothetical protein